MESIKVGSVTIVLNFETQTSPLGRPFRLSGISKNKEVPSVMMNGIEKWHWIYIFIYLDEPKDTFQFEFDHYGKFITPSPNSNN